MRRIFSFVLLLSLLCATFCGCAENTSVTMGTQTTTEQPREAMRIAMIAEYALFTDGYNQMLYGAMKTWCEANGAQYCYYRPKEDNTASRVAAMDQAVAEGYQILLLPGYPFGGAIVECAPKYPDVKFIGVVVGKSDLLEAAVSYAGECYDYNPENWNVEDYLDVQNIYCCSYREEIAGYMAGYAAVKMGYTELGFLGGMPVPTVLRYGYGFVQGAEEAAKQMDTKVHMKHVYGGCDCGGDDLTENMEKWYEEGTQVVFACGGSIYTSAAEAAMKFNGKVIGADMDQSGIIDGHYCEGMTLTSAMKDMSATVTMLLDDIAWCIDGNWEKYSGKLEVLGLPYVGLPESTQWTENFTKQDYEALCRALEDGTLTVLNDISCEPITEYTTVDYIGYLK